MNVTTAKGSGSLGYSTTISIVAGETVALAMNISINGAPLNLAGYSLKARINLPSPLTLTSTNGGIAITDAAQGAIQVNISSATSSQFPAGGYPYDLWMVDGGGAETPILGGNFTVAQNISSVP